MNQEIDENFFCLICTEVASNAVQTNCCGQIMCESCGQDIVDKGHKACPNCRAQLILKASNLARRMISSMKLPCQFCQTKFQQKQLMTHKKMCNSRILKCKDCEKQIKISFLVQHMKQTHLDKIIQLCISYQQGESSQSKVSSASSSKIGSGSNLVVQSLIRNSSKKQSHLGTTGKYYCGERKLIGKCSCCDGRCGPTNGENCDDCMQLDVQKFNLSKGYLVNPLGHVCKFESSNRSCYCGKMIKGQMFCTKDSPCSSCGQVQNSIKLGRYKNLI